MSEGVILGHIAGKVSRIDGVKALFDPKLTAKQACLRFLKSCYRKQPPILVRLSTAVHTACFAPTGVGKGISIVLPHLLTCRDSMVVVDFKSELKNLTATTRRKMGQRVVALDPFGKGKDTFNPMGGIHKESDAALDDCRDLAEAIVVRTGKEHEPHWADSAEIWITAMIAATVCFADDEDKNLQSVRGLLTNTEKMQTAIKMMCESSMWNGMLSRLGYMLTYFKDKELNSVLTTAGRYMSFLDSLAISNSMMTSTFKESELIDGKVTVYLVLPLEHAKKQSPMLRIWISSMLRAVIKGGLSDRKVQFVLDEAATLGQMSVLEDLVDKLRGFGARGLFIYQSFGQLKKCWQEGGDQTFLSNVTQVFFGVNDLETAKYVSDRLGEHTIEVASGGTGASKSESASQQGSGGSASYSTSRNSNWSQIGRKLLKPEEVLAMDEREAITFAPGLPPISSWLVRYYEGNFTPRKVGLLKAIVDTACLFVTVAIIAAILTAAVADGTFK